MRLSDLTVQELLALANVLLKIADDGEGEGEAASGEVIDEIKYILRLVTEKAGHNGAMLAGSALN